MFYVGQKVVCVSDDWWLNGERHDRWYKRLPVCGEVYTIRSIVVLNEFMGGIAGLKLEEFIFPDGSRFDGNGEGAFIATHFRPVIERKTDISIFTRILDDVSKRETVKCP
jgi:hypothetical protein